jgi:formylglycine-generating enzyme required for sulfatase activity
MRRLLSFVFILCAVIGLAAPAAAEKRVALVIGNSAYRHTAALPNPRNDATDVADALKRLDFETIFATDLDKAGMDEIVIRFARAARNADVALFYYAGHAMTFAGGNYLMPVDIRLTDETDIRRMTRVDEIVADLQQARNLRILVLDSCRNNPLAEEFKSSVGSVRSASVQRGLTRIESPQGTIVSFATQAGRTADDGKGRNSPYTTAFLRHIEARAEIGDIFRNITEEVYKASARSQLPELSLSLIGRYYFKGLPEAVAAPSAPQPVPTDPDAAARRDYELAAQVSTREAWDAFLARHPSGYYADLARSARGKLAVVMPPVPPVTPPAPTQPAVGVFPTAPGVHPLSAERERVLKPKDTFKECDACPEMVVVPAGSFTMGSPASEKERRSDEGPERRVTFSRQFAVGRFAVSFDEWDACVADGGCNGYRPGDRAWGRGKQPVINVNWNDAKAYVAWLSRKTGKTYRLLSEAEREYVTRAGTTTPFWWGSTISTVQANYDGSFTYGGTKGEYRQKTMPVDSFQPNPWGLYQVHGNVYDWVEDCWNDSYRGAPTDGSAWTVGDCSSRVLRGGSWDIYPRYLRSAYRHVTYTSYRSNDVGFRLARTLTP